MAMSDPSRNDALDWRRLLPLAAVAVSATAGFAAVQIWDISLLGLLRDNQAALLAFRDANYTLTVLVFLAVYAATVALSLPGATVLTLTGGFLFSTFPGTAFNVVAATIGATAIFMAARMGLGERLGARLEASEGAVKKVKDGIDDNQWSMLFVMRLVPVVPFFVANLVPAFLEVPLSRYVISTFLGIIPGAIVYTSVGAGLGEVFSRGEAPDLAVIFEPKILLPIMGLVMLALLPMILKKTGRIGGQ